MAKTFHLICVGKLKDSHLEAIEADYLKRLTSPTLTIHEVKASAENKEAEGEVILKKIQELAKDGGIFLIALSEWGKRYDSVRFSEWTKNHLEKGPSKIIFLIAGAEGYSQKILDQVQEKLSLSELTFPHKLARILFVEQLYRAQTIRVGHPYHN